MSHTNRISVIPKDWNIVHANGVLQLHSGMRPSQFVTDNPNDVPSLGGENIDENGFLIFDNIRYISRDYYQTMKKGKIKDKDILINKDGANTGKIAFSKQKPFEECAINEHVFIIRNNGEFDQEFLFYFLYSKIGNNQITRKIVGSAQGGINNSFTKGVYIPKPPKPEQTAIANILSKIDEAIEAATQSIKAAEKLKKALMQNLFSGKLRPDGTWRTGDEFYEDEKFGKVPKGWNVKRIKDLSTQVTDGEHTTPRRSNKGFYLLSARNVKHGYLDLSNVDYIDESELIRIQKRCNPEAGDILISCSGTIGNVCIVPDGLKAGMVRSAALVKLRKELIEPEFVELVLQSFPLQLQMKKSVASSVQGNLFQGAIKKLKLAVPVDKEERIAIVRSINNIVVHSQKKQSKIQTLERLKKSLMQQLLTGKRRLSKETIAYINKNL